MGTQRKLIRNKVRELLETGVPLVSSRVYKSRVESLWANAELPCICVYTLDEENDGLSQLPTVDSRNLNLGVEIIAKAEEDSSLDDTLDDISQQVETTLLKSENALGDFNWQAIEYSKAEMAIRPDNDVIVGALRLEFLINYQVEFT